MITRPHYTTAPVIDWYPTDLGVSQVAGITKVYVDTNETHWHCVHLTPEQTRQLYRQLAAVITVPARMADG